MGILPSGLSDQVGDDENLARFLVQSNYFNKTMVKPEAFLPNPKDRETSVSRHGSEPRNQLWSIGHTVAGTHTLYGAAIVKAQDVRAVQLEVTAKEPPDKHAVIIQWPWVEQDAVLQRAQQKAAAMKLAGTATLLSYDERR